MLCHHGGMAYLGNLSRHFHRNGSGAVGRSVGAAAPLAWSPPATVAESMDRSYAAHRAASNRRDQRTNRAWPGPGPEDMSKQEWLRFADHLHRCADDAGIIAIEALPAVCDGEPWAQRAKELARLAGWVEVLGFLVRGGATKGVVKAAVKHLGGRATVAEVAAVTEKTERQVSGAFSACDSLIRVAPRTWAVAPDGYLEFCDALWRNARSNLGRGPVLDEAQLLADLKSDDWNDHLESAAAAAGCMRMSGVLVRDGSARLPRRCCANPSRQAGDQQGDSRQPRLVVGHSGLGRRVLPRTQRRVRAAVEIARRCRQPRWSALCCWRCRAVGSAGVGPGRRIGAGAVGSAVARTPGERQPAAACLRPDRHPSRQRAGAVGVSPLSRRPRRMRQPPPPAHPGAPSDTGRLRAAWIRPRSQRMRPARTHAARAGTISCRLSLWRSPGGCARGAPPIPRSQRRTARQSTLPTRPRSIPEPAEAGAPSTAISPSADGAASVASRPRRPLWRSSRAVRVHRRETVASPCSPYRRHYQPALRSPGPPRGVWHQSSASGVCPGSSGRRRIGWRYCEMPNTDTHGQPLDIEACWPPGSPAVRDLIEVIASHPSYEVRRRIAEACSASPDLLRRLAADSDGLVRGYATANPPCPAKLLPQLAQDDEGGVRFAVACRDDCPAEILESLRATGLLAGPRRPDRYLVGRIRLGREARALGHAQRALGAVALHPSARPPTIDGSASAAIALRNARRHGPQRCLRGGTGTAPLVASVLRADASQRPRRRRVWLFGLRPRHAVASGREPHAASRRAHLPTPGPTR